MDQLDRIDPRLLVVAGPGIGGLLWRWMRQLHHSPARIEILTAFYKHPLEITGESIATSVLLYVVLGVSPEAALVITTVSGVLGLFYHWNIATPLWLGYLVQRPESHCTHHGLGVHAYNYSELPLIDILVGTFRNPRRFVGQCGLGAGREQRFDPRSQLRRLQGRARVILTLRLHQPIKRYQRAEPLALRATAS